MNFSGIEEYFSHVVDKIRLDLEARRRQDRTLNNLGALFKPRGILEIDKVHFYPKENGKEHRTEKYELIHRLPASPIFRRGQSFYFVIRFNNKQTFDPAKDTLKVLFNFGPKPNATQHTQGILNVTGESDFTKDKHEWDVLIRGSDSDSVTLQVQVPPDVSVGIWKCQILCGEQSNPSKVRIFDCADDIYILFNPWCEDDLTYMEDKDLLEEYVLSDVGKIWMGPYGSARGREWVYGQFDDAALPVTVYLLEKSGLPHATRTNPVLITRVLTKMVNANDGDSGVIEGSWSGEYSDGTAPAAWTGSVKILEEYLLTRKPVKYGQCWVFAGVLTSLCRALGIPSRPVSNLVSAHDANGTLTIDRYFNSKGEELQYDPFNPDGSKDSIWNFHVWSEAWMARPDLPKGYGGWQAIDSTPQERSGGFFQCGPASVEAVKNGQVGLAYDVPFVLAEVNADLVRWKEDKKSEIGFIQLDTNKYQIGRQILTKKPNVFDRVGNTDTEEITNNYKSLEGTQEERISLFNAVRGSSRAKRFFQYPSVSKEDVEFDLVELERVPLGDPFSVTVEITNKSSEPRTIDAILSASSVYYTGVKAHTVKKANGTFTIPPNGREELTLQVPAKDYVHKLVEYAIMKLHAMATVRETNQTWAEEDDFQVLTPSLDIQVSGKTQVGKPLQITCSFKNPLKVALTNCKLNYEGPGITRPGSQESKDIPPEGVASVTLNIIPRFAGEHNFVATFDSKELVDITGSTKITVAKA